jgi:ribosome maturation factor RimP
MNRRRSALKIASVIGPFHLLSLSMAFSSWPVPKAFCRPNRKGHSHLSARSKKTVEPIPSFSPSKVTDEDGLTPPEEFSEIETVDESDVPELQYDPNGHPVRHQPWRRGDTDGCHDPIEVPWRLEAEEIIKNAAFGVGANVLDVTWFMGYVLVTLDDDLTRVEGVMGPEIRVQDAWVSSPWGDPDDPEPADDYGIYAGEEDGRILDESGSIVGIENDPYSQQGYDTDTGEIQPSRPRPTREEAVRMISYDDFQRYLSDGMTVEMQDRDERVSNKLSLADYEAKLLKANEEWGFSRDELEKRTKHLRARYLHSEDLAEYYPEEFAKVGFEEPMEKLAMPLLERADGIDTDALSIIARSILDALQDPEVEERLRIVSRHELLLTSLGDPEYLETQSQFDSHRGTDVIVQTQDPFGSNRALKGKLVDRNALDVIINQRGRMVTVPLNMVDYVMIASAGGNNNK